MINFWEARLRSNPHFRLIPFDQLEEREQRAFQSLSAEPDFYGLLEPPSASVIPVKSMSRDAALLFLTLREPACVPHLLTSLFGPNVEDRLRQLVLDGVFEVEHAGGFVSGVAAFPFFGGRPDDVSTCRVVQLSLDAIAY